MMMEDNFYNYEVKKRYLDSIENDILRNFTSYPLKKAVRSENLYGKDVYNMSVPELEDVLSDLSCTTPQAVYNNILRIEDYITWAIDKGYRRNSLNPISEITSKFDWGRKFVATYKNYYFTRSQVLDMVDQLVNPSDRAILLGLFEGIKGVGFQELFNLKEEDIVETENGLYIAKLRGRDSEREIKISEKLARNLINAANRPAYINKNGDSAGGSRYEESKFEPSPFVFKNTNRGRESDGLNPGFITRKLVLFKDIFNAKFLKVKHLTDSGIMHMANDLQKDGTMTASDLVEIATHFNTTLVKRDEYVYRNTTLIKRIIDIPEFEELYGYKMKYEK